LKNKKVYVFGTQCIMQRPSSVQRGTDIPLLLDFLAEAREMAVRRGQILYCILPSSLIPGHSHI